MPLAVNKLKINGQCRILYQRFDFSSFRIGRVHTSHQGARTEATKCEATFKTVRNNVQRQGQYVVQKDTVYFKGRSVVQKERV